VAQSYRSRFLSIMSANERRMKILFSDLAIALVGELTRRAGPDGTIPRSAWPDVQAAVDARVTAFFVGRTAGGQRAPFDILQDGTVFPLSPYARALWQAITNAVRVPVEQEATLMRRVIPPDVMTVMRGATGDPFAAAKAQVREQVFRPNPLARYDAPHLWVDPNGYTLSERIWNTAGDTRRRLDAMLEDGIRRGRGVLNLETGGATGLARDLEQFLIPGRSLRRTRAPYGVDASFDAMRLARTEITRAHGQAAQMAAAMNPFVEGIKWNLSGSHPRPDICDDYASGGPNGDGIYPLNEVPNYPAHPQDMCYLTQVSIPADERQTKLDELRDDIRHERAELVRLVGPLQVDEFTRQLLGQELEIKRAVPVGTPPVSPARVVAPPVATPPQPLGEKPIEIMSTGDPKLAFLKSPVEREMTRKADEALNEIGKVHGYKNVPRGHEITQINDRRNAVNGFFDPEARPSATLKKTYSVVLNRAYLQDNIEHVTSTTVHEMGHWLDFHVLGKGKFASESHIPEMDNLWRAIIKSKRHQQWVGQLERSTGKIKQYHTYVASDAEVFARAYTQHIGQQTKNESILKMIAEDLADNSEIKLQWHADDFVEISQAFTSFLRAMELLQ